MGRLGCSASGSDCVLSVVVTDNTANLPISTNFNAFVPPKLITGLRRAEISLAVGDVDPATGSVSINVDCSVTALWVVLSTLAQGRFSDGAFLLHANQTKTIDFLPWGELRGAAAVAELKQSLRVESLSSYLI